MKKQLLMKTFLVAVCMLVGTSAAWAYEIPAGMEVKEVLIGTLSAGNVVAETFDEDGATVPSFTNSSNFTITDAKPTDQWQSLASSFSGNVLRLGSRTTHEIDFSSVISSGKVVFSADFYVGINQKIIKFIDEDNQVVARFVFPDKNASNGRVYGTQYMFVDVDNKASFSSTPSISDTWQGTRNREYRITELVIDLDANTITYSGKVMDRRSSTDKWCDDNATITLSKDVTIKGMIIDASGVSNNTYYAYYDNMKLFSVGNAAGTHNYTINAVAGGTTIKELATGSATEGDNYGTFLPKAILYNSQYYVLSDANVSNFYANFTMGDDDVTKEVTYTLNANMKAFWEAENMDYVGHSWYSDGNQTDNSGCSNGGAKCPYSGTSNGIRVNSTIASGVYDITIKPYRWGDAATDYTLQYSTDNVNWTTVETVSFASTSNDAYVADNILIPGDSYLRLLSPGSTPRHAIDYIYVERTGDATVTATIPTSGYGTIASAYALDCANLPDGLKAYKVSELTSTTVTLEEVTEAVAANTGLILKGTASTAYDIPVVASGTDISATNKLKAAVTATEIAANEAYILQSGEFHLVNAASTIPAGKAYLLASDITGGARSLNFTFDATAIKAVEGEIQNGEFYNVAGQRVAVPTKGLYIVNGKKVIIK